MRLARYGPVGQESPAVMVPGSDHLAIDISDITTDIDGALLEGGLDAVAAALRERAAPGSTCATCAWGLRSPGRVRSTPSG
jgi:hypothetical protein